MAPKTRSRVVADVYPRAGAKAPALVRQAIMEFRALSAEERAKRPLLYWLLGSGTPPYKMAKVDSDYVTDVAAMSPDHQVSDNGKPLVIPPGQTCGNCAFAYQHVTTKHFICSQVEGFIQPQAWCRLWRVESRR